MGDVVNIASRLQALAPPKAACWSATRRRSLCSRRDPLRTARRRPSCRGREQIEKAWLALGTMAPRGEPPMAAPRSRSSDASPNARLLESVTELVATGHCAIVSVIGEARDRQVAPGATRRSPLVADCSPRRQCIQGMCAPYGEPNVWWPIAHGLAAGMGLQLDQPAAEVREIVGRRDRRDVRPAARRHAGLQRGRGVAASARAPVRARRARHHRRPATPRCTTR